MSSPVVLSPSIRGISYPLRIEGGNLVTNSDYALVSEQIRSLLDTRYFERVMRADYGIGDYVLEIMDPGQINSAIQYSILQNVPNVSDLYVTGEWQTGGDDGVYRVTIVYSLNGVPQPPLNFALAN